MITNFVLLSLSMIVTNWVTNAPLRFEVDAISGKPYAIEQGYISSNYVHRTIRADGLVRDQILDSRAVNNDKELTRRSPVDLVGVLKVAAPERAPRSIPPMPLQPQNYWVTNNRWMTNTFGPLTNWAPETNVILTRTITTDDPNLEIIDQVTNVIIRTKQFRVASNSWTFPAIGTNIRTKPIK